MYLVKLPNHHERGVELNEFERGEWIAKLDDGTEVNLKVRGLRDGEFHVQVNGAMHKISLRQDAEGQLSIEDGGERFPFEIVHAADLVLRDGMKKTNVAEASVEVLTSPITGIIVDVPVTMGDYVERGKSVVVIEAMKMENALGAPIPGKISNVYVKPGDTIFVGDKLVEIQGEE